MRRKKPKQIDTLVKPCFLDNTFKMLWAKQAKQEKTQRGFGRELTPPLRKITKIISPEYFYVILGGSYGKIA